MALLLVLGHVCELPAYVTFAAAPHEAEAPGHAGHDADHDPGMSCDPVDAVASTAAPATVAPALSVAHVVALDCPLVGRPLAAPLRASERPPGNVPLFLLNASLLI